MARRGRPVIHTGCSVDGCPTKHHSRGLCFKHYLRQWKGIVVDASPITKICSIPACDKKVVAQNLCTNHVQKHYRDTLWNDLIGYEYECEHGTVHDNKSQCRCGQKSYDKRGKKTKEHVGYAAVHRRLDRHRGFAKDHQCIVGGDHPAKDWALQGEPQYYEERNNRQYGYSLIESDYEPMCRHHHALLDGGYEHYGWTPKST